MTIAGLKSLETFLDKKSISERMPVMFIGHGSPMNAIASNSFTKTLNTLGEKIAKPKAILVVSAHWMTEGTWVTEMASPKTIHDFFGFPQALFDVQYPAPGSPELANVVKELIETPRVQGDTSHWGLDHGTWSVLKHLYPQADIPVLQLSLDMTQSADFHYKLGMQLKALRDRGVLIIGSGNLVHNLRTIRWEPNAPAFDWAIEFDEWTREKLVAKDYQAFINDIHKSNAGRLSVPTLDHYLPVHYILGAADADEDVRFEFEEMQNGSISMRSFSFGRS